MSADDGRVTTLWLAVALDAPEPMLAQLASRLPTGASRRYEPKLDGFRGLLEHAIERAPATHQSQSQRPDPLVPLAVAV